MVAASARAFQVTALQVLPVVAGGQQGAAQRQQGALAPRELVACLISNRVTRLPGVQPGRQGDSLESVLNVLTRLRASPLYGKAQQNAFGKLFRFQLEQNKSCECGASWKGKGETAYSLELGMPAFRSAAVTLQSLLTAYTDDTSFPEGTRCRHCAAVDRVELRSAVKTAPPLLFMTLKRFRVKEGSSRISKDNTRVDFPTSFAHPDLAAGASLKLRAVILHAGALPTSGHNTAIGKSSEAANACCHSFACTVDVVAALPD